MKKDKMERWICRCEYRGEKFTCKLITQSVTKPHMCPFGVSNGTWEKKKKQ